VTERVPGESARRAMALAAHRPARRPRGELSSNDECSLVPCVGGRVFLCRRSSIDARATSSRRVVETLRGGDVPRLDIFLEFYTEAATVACSKEARRAMGVRVLIRAETRQKLGHRRATIVTATHTSVNTLAVNEIVFVTE
jgi:hypothetical protein